MRTACALLILLTLVGCGTTPAKKVNLGTPSLTELGNQSIIDLGWWREIHVNAMLLHNSLGNAPKQFTDEQTGVEFSIIGIEERFNVETIEFTIETKESKITIFGLGTNKVAAKDQSGNSVDIDLIQIDKSGGPNHNVLNHFILVLPLKLSRDMEYFTIRGKDVYDEDVQFEMRWRFI